MLTDNILYIILQKMYPLIQHMYECYLIICRNFIENYNKLTKLAYNYDINTKLLQEKMCFIHSLKP